MDEKKNTELAISKYRAELLSILNEKDIKVLLECESLLSSLAFCNSIIDAIGDFNHSLDECLYPYLTYYSLHQLLSFLGIRK